MRHEQMWLSGRRLLAGHAGLSLFGALAVFLPFRKTAGLRRWYAVYVVLAAAAVAAVFTAVKLRRDPFSNASPFLMYLVHTAAVAGVAVALLHHDAGSDAQERTIRDVRGDVVQLSLMQALAHGVAFAVM